MGSKVAELEEFKKKIKGEDISDYLLFYIYEMTEFYPLNLKKSIFYPSLKFVNNTC